MKMEIVNPSDECYLENDDIEASAFVTMVISSGQYPLKDMDGNELMPLFLFGGCEEYWLKKFGHSIEVFLESEGVDKRLVDVCDSFYYVRERSSLNDIGKAFKSFGETARKKSLQEESG